MNYRARHDAARMTGGKRRRMRARIAGRDGRLCHYCRRPFGSLYGVSVDHFVPHTLMPGHSPANLVLACAGCNHAKQDTLPLTLAWLLLARFAGAAVVPLAPFTADWPVFRAAFTAAAPARIGSPVGTDRGRAFEVVFTLTATVFTGVQSGVQSGRDRALRSARAVVPTTRRGRTVTWRNTRALTCVTAPVTPNVTRPGSADPDPIPGVWSDPIGADWIGRSAPTGSAVNTDHRPVNTPPGIARSRTLDPTRSGNRPIDSQPAVNTQPAPVNTGVHTLNTPGWEVAA